MQKTILLVNEKGLHARAAALFVKIASNYPKCVIEASHADQSVSGTSILGLMMLSAHKGSPLTITIKGNNATYNQKALNALTELLEKGFYEDDKRSK